MAIIYHPISSNSLYFNHPHEASFIKQETVNTVERDRIGRLKHLNQQKYFINQKLLKNNSLHTLSNSKLQHTDKYLSVGY